MKNSNKHIRSVSNHSVRNRSVFVPLSAGFCATALAITGGVVANASAVSSVASASSVVKSSAAKLTDAKVSKPANSVGEGVSDSERSAVQHTSDTSITEEQAKSMKGCEAEIQTIDGVKYLVIKPKDGTEGIISANYRPEEFETLHNKIISDEASGATLKFEGKVYGYGSLFLWDNPSDVIKNFSLFSNSKIKSLGNIDKFDVSNVTDMTKLFKGCTNLESLDGLENWNIKNVTEMSGIFEDCNKLTNLSALQDWDTSKVLYMDSVFKDCTNLKDI